MSHFRINTSKILLTILIGAIIISFMISDRYSAGPIGANGSIAARVGKQTVTMLEFEQAYRSRMAFYRQIFQGRDFSEKELKKMKIKESVIGELINQRLMLQLGQNLGLSVGHAQLLDYIKQMSVFKKNEVFDAELYKERLANAQLSSKQFEDQIQNELENQQIEELFAQYPISSTFLEDMEKIKSDKRSLDLVHWSKNDLFSFIEKTPQDIEAFLKDTKADNSKKVLALFNERKSQFDKPEMVNVSHILLTKNKEETDASFDQRVKDLQGKLTVESFAKLAQEFSADPGSKSQGGSLGTTPKGQMVPAFDEVAFSIPVGEISQPTKSDFGVHFILVHNKIPAQIAQFKDYESSLALELLQKSSKKEIEDLHMKLKKDVLQLLKTDMLALEELTKKYKLTLHKEESVNMLSKNIGSVDLEAKDLKQIFTNTPNSTLEWDAPTYSAIALLKNSTPQVKETETPQENRPKKGDDQVLKRDFISAIKNNALDSLKNKLSVRSYIQEAEV